MQRFSSVFVLLLLQQIWLFGDFFGYKKNLNCNYNN